MFKRLKHFITKWFRNQSPITNRTQPTVAKGSKVGNVTIQSQAQLDKHTPFKVGESYRIGEMVVTLHANKASMLAAISKVDARRAVREARLRERAIDIMLMKPEELQALKVTEWLQGRSERLSWYKRLFNWNKRFTEPLEPQIKGTLQGRFEDTMQPALEAKTDLVLASVKDRESV